MKLLALPLLLCLSFGAAAQKKPAYADARQVYDEISKIQYATGLWYKKPLQERLQARRQADALAKRAERLFPQQMSQCRQAAIFAAEYVGALNDFALVVEGRRQLRDPGDLYAPMMNASVFGERKAACYDEVEALDAKS